MQRMARMKKKVVLLSATLIAMAVYILLSGVNESHIQEGLQRLLLNEPSRPLVRPHSSSYNVSAHHKVQNQDNSSKSAGIHVGQPPTASRLREDSHRQRNYRIQVYEREGMIAKLPYLRRLHKELGSKKRRHVNCGNNITIELTAGDQGNHYSGIDAVVFDIGNRVMPATMPKADEVNPNQVWVMAAHECPMKVSPASMDIKNFPVHATWTYHRKSELSAAMGYYRPGVPATKSRRKSAAEWLEGKTKTVAWVASNCDKTTWPRTNYVLELSKTIKVDMYGRCGNISCPKGTSNCALVNLLNTYKFYLALENSECADYITEKTWVTCLRNGIVPIVYGPSRKDYEELLPPGSFIYIGDFSTVVELADYLRKLDSNPELYARFFEWRYSGRISNVEFRTSHSFCLAIPVIERVRRGELKLHELGLSKYYQSCRKGSKISRNPKWDERWRDWSPW